MEDFTAANIAVSDEKREEELEKVKRGKVDYSKLEAEVEEAKSNALEVSQRRLCTKESATLIAITLFVDLHTLCDPRQCTSNRRLRDCLHRYRFNACRAT